MRFDIDKMEPLFVLDIGRPGSSYALEIARKIGLPPKLLEAAGARVGFGQVNYEKLLGELEQEKEKLSHQVQQVTARENELRRLVSEYEELKKFIEGKQKGILNEAKSQAREILEDANKTIEKTIREIKESGAEKKRTKEIRDKLREKRKNLGAEKSAVMPEYAGRVLPDKLTPGRWAQVKGQITQGQVISVSKGMAELAVGQIKIRIKIDNLIPLPDSLSGGSKNPSAARIPRGLDMNEKLQQFSRTLDLRGKRGDEALKELDHYLDQAILLNIPEVKILHGKGDGILRRLIREQLKKYPFIADYSDEHADRGGAGITLVSMK
jgi:DNA mismatch repair protein MutS2